MKSISLWDLPTRLFHWLLVAAVTGSLVTVKLGGTWMLWHERFGITIVGLISFRLMWGVLGSTYARFLQFIPGPSAIEAYLKGEWRGLAQSVGSTLGSGHARASRLSGSYRAVFDRCHCV